MKRLPEVATRNHHYFHSHGRNIKHQRLLQLLQDPSWVQSLDATKSLHAITTTMGANPIQPTVFLQNNIIAKYVSFNNVHMAHHLFDRMPLRNVVSYNTMISAYSRIGHIEIALKLFSEMRASGLRPTQFTLGALLSCTLLEMLHGLQLQALIEKSGFLYRDAFAGTALLGMFGRQGQVNDAIGVFEDMPIKSLVTWNCMISLFGQHDYNQNSLFMFKKVMRYGVDLPESTLVCAMSSLDKECDLQFGEQVHCIAVKCALDNAVSVANCLINMYAKCSGTLLAFKMFEVIVNKDVVSWNTIIGAIAKSDGPDKAIDIFLRMYLCADVLPNESTFVSLISSCSLLQNLLYGEYIHAKTIRRGLKSGVYVGSALVDFYAKSYRLEDAHRCFDEILAKNLVSWNTLMLGYSLRGSLVSLSLLKEMMQFGHLPNEFSFSAILNSCLASELQQLHSLIIKIGYDEYEYIKTALITSYGRMGVLSDALIFAVSGGTSHSVAMTNAIAGIYNRTGEFYKTQELFSLHEKPDIVSWNILIAACSRSGDYEEVFELFGHMQNSDVHPDNYTYVSLFSVCTKLCNLALGSSLHGLLIKTCFNHSDIFVSNILMDMYAKCGCLKSSVKIFDEMTGTNVISWTIVISALGLHGHAHEALQKFKEMEIEGFKPDKVAFIAVLSACRHVGLVREGMKLFEQMKSKYEIEPGMDHYHLVVDLLARYGHLREAEHLISQMPFPPNVMIWRSFLEGCKRKGTAENLGIAV